MAELLSVQERADVTAKPPYPPRRRGIGLYLRQYLGLVKVLLTEYRTTYSFHVIFGLAMPLGMIFFLRFVTGGEITTERAIFIMGGNLTTSVVFGPTSMLTAKIGWGRHNREFDYWAALPLPKLGLVLAIVTAALVMALPGLLSLFFIGGWILGLPLARGLMLLPLVPIGTLSLVGLGAILGTFAKDGHTANHLSNLLLLFVTFLSPTMIPLENMPQALQFIAPLTPIHYVARAFRSALAGDLGMAMATDVGVMLLFGLGFLLLAHWKLDWRAS